MAADPLLLGSVTAFDERAGLGAVTAEDGGEFSFHCTAISDGTRSIAVGTRVVFRVVAGRNGRWEAAGLVGV